MSAPPNGILGALWQWASGNSTARRGRSSPRRWPANSTNAWDGSRNAVVLADQNSSWSWSGAQWADLTPTVNAPYGPLVFDAAQGRLMPINSSGDWVSLR